MNHWIGYKWLATEYGIDCVHPFPVTSRIGKSRTSTTIDGIRVETYTEALRPRPLLGDHLTFALKREGVHLEFLARLFDLLPPAALLEWIASEPSGQYARRAGFFYEWLTGRRLDFPGVPVGNYVPALPEQEYLTSTRSENVSRWRVRNNLPGSSSFCPTVRRVPAIKELEAYDCRALLDDVDTEFGADILQRSAVWLTIKESRASFQIEHEESRTDRVKRFAIVMEKWCGTGRNSLDAAFLAQLQTEILGNRALYYGPRRSPVFIGETRITGEVVHYVAPHWEQIDGLLLGLSRFEMSTKGRAPLLRAAVLSFGFVYIHPMTDGNRRISRFLVNDTLRRDGAVLAPLILPISATITRGVANRAAYDRALEQFSRPLMELYGSACSFGARRKCEDGVVTDFEFGAYNSARHAWAYPDLTPQTAYLGGVIQETIQTELRGEAAFLLDLLEVRERVKQVIEGPDVDIDRIIRSIRQSRGVPSSKLVKEFPLLGDDETHRAVVRAVLGEDLEAPR